MDRTETGILIALTLLVVLAVLLSITITTAQSAASQGSTSAPALSFADGKICSGAIGGVFRDSINVPDAYRIADCEALAKKLVLSVARRSRNFTYNLGCLTDRGYTWGDNSGQLPTPNPCNWSQ